MRNPDTGAATFQPPQMGRPLLTASGAVLGILGLACLFAPDEVLGRLGQPAAAPGGVLAQLFGAALLGLALLDWVSRHSPLGGIYARPLAVVNFVHFGIGSLVLGRHLAGHRQGSGVLWALLAIYAVLGSGFASALFRRRRGDAPGSR